MSDDSVGTDPSTAYENLRRESAALLGFDPGGDLTALQQMQIDVASIVRMEIDAAQGAQLAGKEIDIARLSVCVTMLQKLLPQRALEAETRPDFSGAREELERLLQSRFEAIEYNYARQSEAEAEVQADYYRDLARSPAPARIGPPAPARVEYIDAAVINDRDEPSPPAPAAPAPPAPAPAPAPVPMRAAPQQSDAEWLRWYRAGGGNARQPGWDSPPRGW